MSQKPREMLVTAACVYKSPEAKWQPMGGSNPTENSSSEHRDAGGGNLNGAPQNARVEGTNWNRLKAVEATAGP